MTALELRLGNYAQDKKTGQLLIVVDLSGKEVGYMPTSNMALPDGWQAEPIPITEDWLVKFRFVKNSRNEYKHPDAPVYFVVHPGNPAKLVCFVHNCSHGHIEFLHQLQNLFFVVRNHELRAEGLPAFKLQ